MEFRMLQWGGVLSFIWTLLTAGICVAADHQEQGVAVEVKMNDRRAEVSNVKDEADGRSDVIKGEESSLNGLSGSEKKSTEISPEKETEIEIDTVQDTKEPLANEKDVEAFDEDTEERELQQEIEEEENGKSAGAISTEIDALDNEDETDVDDTEAVPVVESPGRLEPLYVRELTEIISGHNDSNPVWSPSGKIIAFERSRADKKEIIIAGMDGSVREKIYFQLNKNENEMDFFFPGLFEDVSYNAGISWSPSGDRFVFMSNGGGGNYDLYLRSIGSEAIKRLTEHKEKDGHVHWSPKSDRLIFVSGRTGNGDIYLMDLDTEAIKRLTDGEKAYLYPQWSPDGTKIVTIYGSNENHDVYLITDIAGPRQTLKALTRWTYDDLRPVWSPDGKKIAFYSNYNIDDDPKSWSLVVIASNGTDPVDGEGLIARVVASDIIPDIERGPAWMPDSRRILYVKNERHTYNPIYVVDIEDKTNLLLDTETKMNHDVTCSSDGTIAFRAQVRQWDHIYIARLRE